MTSRTPECRELTEAKRLSQTLQGMGEVRTLCEVGDQGGKAPLLAFTFGSRDPEAPTLIVSGGVHGLERIGTEVALSFLNSLSERLSWDQSLRWELDRIRIAIIPLVNPIGMSRGWRSNGNGVDLMRNSPVEAGPGATPILGGHRISPRLPWYRGPAAGQMEAEAQALCDFVLEVSERSRVCLALDLHSGFGLDDRLWFPYAKSTEPFPNLPQIHALKSLLDRVYPQHIYRIEPQSKNYTTHGDLWDYLYELKRKQHPENLFLPLTLEMGSWNWVKKNPWQLFSFLGPFHPVKPHRVKRTLRRHLVLFDFLIKATLWSEPWNGLDHAQLEHHAQEALKLWYPLPNHPQVK